MVSTNDLLVLSCLLSGVLSKACYAKTKDHGLKI